MNTDNQFIPNTQLYVGQSVRFKSVENEEFAINDKPATIIEYEKHEAESVDWPHGIAICIQFGSEFNLRKTWGRTDEIFPVEKEVVT